VNGFLGRVSGQILNFIKGLSPAKRIGLGVLTVTVVLFFAGIFYWANQTSFNSLLTNLNPEDAANIMRVLKEKRIPYTVDASGKNISVPAESVDLMRLELATLGMPQSSVVGYEVFDKSSLGTTSFVQKINQKRALEGEITRTINSIKGVLRSRIHLAMPQKGTFAEDNKKPSASVVLDLQPGTQLNEKQVFGIGNLVAKAVEGMDIADVVIVDSNGKTLSKNSQDSLTAATASQLEYQQKVESETEKRIENILTRVVGEGRVVAKVSAELDFSQVNETQTMYDQDGAVLRQSDRRVDSAQGSRPGPRGPAGTAANDANAPASNGDIRTETNKNNELLNYDVPSTVRRLIKPSGTIKRLSVAVLLDGKRGKATVGADGKEEPAKAEAWSADKLKEFEGLVASAAGIDLKRGDRIEIKNMEFTNEDFESAERLVSERERKAYYQNLALSLAIGLTVLLFFLFVVRPFIKWVTDNTIESVDTFLPQTIEELEKMQKGVNLPGLDDVMPVLPDKIDPEKVEGEMIKEKIITLVDTNPHKAALILKDWLHEEPRRAKGADAPAGGRAGATA
jgi:flagellar M-ring protein FliF